MERRAFIAAGATAPLAGFAQAKPADPLVEYLENWKAARTDLDSSKLTQQEFYWENLICTTQAVSAAGLAAQLEYAAIGLEGEWTGNLTDNLDGQLLQNMRDFSGNF